MREQFIVSYIHDDYEHVSEHVEDGFETYEAALAYAKSVSKCTDNGRLVNYTATIYRVTNVTDVYQQRETEEFIIEKFNFETL